MVSLESLQNKTQFLSLVFEQPSIFFVLRMKLCEVLAMFQSRGLFLTRRYVLMR